MGGELNISSNWNESDKNNFPYIELNFAFRKLVDNTVCLAIPKIFFERKITENNLKVWLAFMIDRPSFHKDNIEFDRWVDRYINGSWEVEDGPKKQIEIELKLINALTQIEFKSQFFRHDDFRLINYPIAENNEEYVKSINELYRLIIDGMDISTIIKISNYFKINLTNNSFRLNSLKEILPNELIDKIHTPIKVVSEKRMPIHGIPTKGNISFPAFDTFRSDLTSTCKALTHLKKWLESEFNLNAESCMNRLESLSLFPDLNKDTCHEETKKRAKMMVGKKIEKVEYGITNNNENSHRSEAINIYFDDGTAISICIGSNASDIADRYENLKPNDIHTDIMLFWANKIKKNHEN
jgi:hypothetical protein